MKDPKTTFQRLLVRKLNSNSEKREETALDLSKRCQKTDRRQIPPSPK